ncbi:hypothetical protein BDW75DRAFT_221958 [Aspergillus navahoensis]
MSRLAIIVDPGGLDLVLLVSPLSICSSSQVRLRARRGRRRYFTGGQTKSGSVFRRRRHSCVWMNEPGVLFAGMDHWTVEDRMGIGPRYQS